MIDIPNFEGLYAITEDGKVWSYRRNMFLKTKLDTDGYVMVRPCLKGKTYIFKLHRLVASAFIPNLDDKPQVNHKDGNKLNNNVSNLEWVTCIENAKHARLTGLINQQGENSKKAKLTNEQVREIREYIYNGVKLTDLANRYNVCIQTISNIKYKKRYKFA